jgi:hypothetical protein
MILITYDGRAGREMFCTACPICSRYLEFTVSSPFFCPRCKMSLPNLNDLMDLRSDRLDHHFHGKDYVMGDELSV